MGHPLEHVIEERIREAMEKGDLSDLPNAGKPIANLAESTEDTLARVMREQGGKPAFVLLNGKLQALLTRMTETDDPLARRAIEQQIADLRTKLAIEKNGEAEPFLAGHRPLEKPPSPPVILRPIG